MHTVRLQPLARAKVASLGEAGAAWLDRLPAVLEELAGQWDLTWERPLPGGSASYVVGARTADGEPRVVKVVLPAGTTGEVTADAGHEAAVLRAAGGHGYALLHDHAPAHGALLLERLGSSLARAPGTPERTLDTLVDTLRRAWTADLAAPRPDRAGELRDLVVRLDDRHHACDPAVRRQAVAYAERLSAPGPDADVLLHGDPHPGNALACARTGAHVLVDPDGFRGDPAYDLGVALRDRGERVLDEGRGVVERWCDRVAGRSGVDRGRTWCWAFLERVSTGLYVLDFGADRVARPFLDSARLLVDQR
ncbi:aminoglycoside phosphotransferase family protein [Nocardioides aequoreus]|uniref:aminoglycoside phosphotransferase family protein n=1 Tax=Nocardioides aequoreus TaxID=397278 RepID=UPI000690B9FF|nr:aminoglycoside phosphotransferase family protein [Nocardioides aequoreus]